MLGHYILSSRVAVLRSVTVLRERGFPVLTMQMHAVLVTIMKCAKRYGKFYSFPSELKILEHLKTYHGIEICERTLRRILRALEKFKFMETIHRTRIDKSGRRVWTSNLYKLKQKAFMWLMRLENLVKGLFSHFRRPKLSGYKLNQKQRFTPVASSSVEIVWIKDKDGQVRGWNPLIGEFIER